MTRVQLNTNGTQPLADTTLGTNGVMTGAERAKLQAIGAVQEAVLAANTALGGAFAALASVSLVAGTWFIGGQGAHTFTDNGLTEFRIRNVTDATVLSYSGETDAASTPQSRVLPLAGRTVVLAGTKTFAIEGKTAHTFADSAVGSASGATTFISAVRIG